LYDDLMTASAARPDVLAPPDRLSDRLAAVLATRIERGELQPDDRLPTEAELSDRHGVSRTVVREAVSRLKSMGLVVSRQGSGVYVAPQASARPLAFDPSVLGSLEAVMQVVEVRRALEGEVAALAAHRGSPAQVAAIHAALDAIGDATAAGRDGVEEDVAFHRAIAEAAGNPQFTRLLGYLEQYQRPAMRVTRANEARRSDFAAQVRHEHDQIARAIEAGDAEAARRAATLHMVNAAARLVAADAPLRTERRP
jgi:GntR family transcriptional repressor for pyruvate dehydrogenase complex